MAKEKINVWIPEIDDLNDISIETLNFVFKQGELYLTELVKIYDNTISRAYTLLSIYISILGIMITFLATNLVSGGYDKEDTPILIILSFTLIPMIYCLFIIIGIIFPNQLMVTGRPPKELIPNKLMDIPVGDKLLYLLYNECIHLQTKVAYNELINTRRLASLKRVIITSVSTFIISFILIVSFYFFY
ncbi:MAG: hypothetical protein SFU99_21435 [Saprospiraceae bacterium]|nr:hypothetical protein [Saprospiraceae bacterium]